MKTIFHSKKNKFLKVVAALLIAASLYLLFIVPYDIITMFRINMWSALTSTNSEMYHPLAIYILPFESIKSIGMALLFCFVTFSFAKQKKIAPKLIIAYLLLNVISVSLDEYLSGYFYLLEDEGDFLPQIVNLLFFSLLVILLLQKSKAVKRTFVK